MENKYAKAEYQSSSKKEEFDAETEKLFNENSQKIKAPFGPGRNIDRATFDRERKTEFDRQMDSAILESKKLNDQSQDLGAFIRTMNNGEKVYQYGSDDDLKKNALVLIEYYERLIKTNAA
ncbi:MAG: hypothetical protein LBT51_00970, partial [Fusobacteriaceae bacterium]|nr:hypothetical protein [Fusobacteriaceae bacterium]